MYCINRRCSTIQLRFGIAIYVVQVLNITGHETTGSVVLETSFERLQMYCIRRKPGLQVHCCNNRTNGMAHPASLLQAVLNTSDYNYKRAKSSLAFKDKN